MKEKRLTLFLAITLVLTLLSFVSAEDCRVEGQSCGYAPGIDCCQGLDCDYFQCVDRNEIVCGDGICQYPETKTTCSLDCGEPPICGNGICEAGETLGATYYCENDCGNNPDTFNWKQIVIFSIIVILVILISFNFYKYLKKGKR